MTTIEQPLTGEYHTLPKERLASVQGWGMLDTVAGYVYRPSTVEGIAEALGTARTSGHSVVPRGTGYSYGDVSLNRENIVLDLTRMDRVLEWNPATGLIRVEPGVTVRRLWEYVIEDGWWPPVVPGAMYPTIGGCAAVNVHGKNNWHAGPMSEHIVALDMVLASGETVSCSRELNTELFRAGLGGLGMLGVITGISLQMKRVSSGLLHVRQFDVCSLSNMLERFEDFTPTAAYVVGWIDAFAGGPALGRGLVQVADYVDEDSAASITLRAAFQHLPDTVAGVIPRSKVWLGMKPFVNDAGMRLLNKLQFSTGSFRAGQASYVPHAQFHFFHDFIPGWKLSFTPGGILQYQIFIPAENAEYVFHTLLQTSQSNHLYPYLAVLKRHRSDSSLLRYNVDGYSLSLDYRAHPGNLRRLREMLTFISRHTVLPAGGRFYPAKDTMSPVGSATSIFGIDVVAEFLACKRTVDPDGLFQSDLFRRWFATPGAPGGVG